MHALKSLEGIARGLKPRVFMEKRYITRFPPISATKRMYSKRIIQVFMVTAKWIFGVKIYSSQNLLRGYQKTPQYPSERLWTFSHLKVQFLASVLVLLDSPPQAGRTPRIIWDDSIFRYHLIAPSSHSVLFARFTYSPLQLFFHVSAST